MNIEHHFISSISYNYDQVAEKGKIVNFFWVSSHIGIHGNKKADIAAKFVLQFEVAKYR